MCIKVSGCIVTYNNSDIICRCIESVLKETKELDFTLYVVDNKSTDNTVKLVRDNFPRVNIIENSCNIGFGNGHNVMLDVIDSKYHVVINPDIVLKQNAIKHMTDYLIANKDVAVIAPEIVNPDGTRQELPKYGPTIRYAILAKFKPFRYLRKAYTREEENLSAPTEVEFASGSFFEISTELFKTLKGFDPRFFMYCEDADLSRRAMEYGKIIFYPLTNAVHDWRRDNTRNLRGAIRFMTSLGKYFSKWGILI